MEAIRRVVFRACKTKWDARKKKLFTHLMLIYYLLYCLLRLSRSKHTFQFRTNVFFKLSKTRLNTSISNWILIDRMAKNKIFMHEECHLTTSTYFRSGTKGNLGLCPQHWWVPLCIRRYRFLLCLLFDLGSGFQERASSFRESSKLQQPPWLRHSCLATHCQ